MIDLKEVLWKKAEPSVFITREEFYSWLAPWEINPVEIDGELAFVTLQNSAAFHFTSLDTKRRISLAMIEAFLTPIIEKHGFATTRTPHADVRQHRFNLRFGFVPFGQDEFDVFYRIEKLR